MTQAHQAWQRTAPELKHQVLESACQNNKKLYRLILERAATALKTRLPKLLEEPRKERHARLAAILGSPPFDAMTHNLFSDWLLHQEQKMMVAFLNSLGIEHDGAGCAEQFPEDPDPEKLKKAVERLYQQFDEEKVTLYLTLFEAVAGCHWPQLETLIRCEVATFV